MYPGVASNSQQPSSLSLSFKCCGYRYTPQSPAVPASEPQLFWAAPTAMKTDREEERDSWDEKVRGKAKVFSLLPMDHTFTDTASSLKSFTQELGAWLSQ